MKCRYCRRDLPENSVFCCWCGKSQLAQSAKIPKVPKPVTLGSGEYYGRVMIDGRRVSVKAETEDEYNAKVAALKSGVVEAHYRLPPISLHEAEKQYIDKRRAVLSPSTVNGYESMMKTRFLKYQRKCIDKINYQQMINDEVTLDVSARTVKNAWCFVKSVLRDSGREAPDIAIPQIVFKDLPFLDFEQIKTFLDAVKGKPCELAALLALHSLRRSELLAITPAKIDLDRLVIHVEGSRVRGSGNVMVSKDTNKTRASRRDVPIVIPRLEELLRAQLPSLADDDRLITTNPNSMHGAINLYCEKAGLPKVGVHGLRRSFASLAFHLGWPELQTMRIGGWSEPTTVRKVYTKLAQADVDLGVKDMREFYGFTAKLPVNQKS